ncbi:unnamed protein product, partial [Mesorhabditis belari]|uniref:Uncharacterized protein n=1 Tax=Mesorhabditis belari TaxID=2138241 RepID=A0AAF3J723_9BILA
MRRISLFDKYEMLKQRENATIACRHKELNVYVEDELPGYLVVMTANVYVEDELPGDAISRFSSAPTLSLIGWCLLSIKGFGRFLPECESFGLQDFSSVKLFDVMAKLHSAGTSGKTEIVEKTTDIQKKLKAAIARRLKELDVYVEDELPDYVMVMVGKRRRCAPISRLSLSPTRTLLLIVCSM